VHVEHVAGRDIDRHPQLLRWLSCSTIRAGTWAPHVSTWPALARLVRLDVEGPLGNPQFSGVVVGIVVVVPTGLFSGSDVEVPGRLVVVVPDGAVPGSDVVVGGTVVVVAGPVVVVLDGGTEVVVVGPVVVVLDGGTEVVVAEIVVVGPVVVVVDGVTELPTVTGAETPNMPDELSVTSSTVVPGSTRATFTVATPSAKVTLLPVVQSPWAGYCGAVPSGASLGPEKVRHWGPV